MNEFEKAKAYIVDKNTSLPKTSKELGIPLQTLKGYRMNPDKLKTAAWERVHKLAEAYKRKQYKFINGEVRKHEKF